MDMQQDLNVWAGLGTEDFGFEDLNPLCVIAEAIDERCAVAGVGELVGHSIDDLVNLVNISNQTHAKVTSWPSVELYEAIYNKICELLPHFISLDGYRSLYENSLSVPYNVYIEQQYSNFPFPYPAEAARKVGHNCQRYPREMAGVENAEILREWYGACKWAIQLMRAVDVSKLAFVANKFDFEGTYDLERDASGEVYYSNGTINGEDVSGLTSMNSIFNAARVSSIETSISANMVSLADHSWGTIFSYEYYTYIDEYRTGESYPYQYHAGKADGKQSDYICRNWPGLVRFQNPAPLSGMLHLVLKPSQRLYKTVRTPELITYSTEPSDYPQYPWIEVPKDCQHLKQYLAYYPLSGSVFEDTGVFSLKTYIPYTATYPTQIFTISAISCCNNFDGSFLISTAIAEQYEGDVKYASDCFTDVEMVLCDGSTFWQKGEHDTIVSPIRAYSIKDQTIFNSVEAPTWIDYGNFDTQITTEDYWHYYNSLILEIAYNQKAVAYIDYSTSFKYV